MHVANLELCKELYELSGWELDVEYCYDIIQGKVWLAKECSQTHPEQLKAFYPAYHLGYLLRKLPEIRLETWHDGHVVVKHFTRNGMPEKLERLGYVVKAEADTPEDAATKLAIELFKAGVLERQS